MKRDEPRERLAFSCGLAGGGVSPRTGTPGDAGPARAAAAPAETGVERGRQRAARRDWAFTGLLLFTAVLYFRPQDTLTVLRPVHVAEIAAVFALGALVFGRLGRGLSLTRITPELAGVLALAGVILATAPFSVWPGGAIGTFSELYVKVLLIFVLMVNTLDSPKRVEQLTWLIVLASGYIAGRTVLDYARGVHLIENGRVMGAVGGMFKNPNDLALNMVAVLPLSALLVVRPLPPVRRSLAAACAALMLSAIVLSQSRSGALGLGVMALVLAGYLVRRKPGLVFGAILAAAVALPFAPSSYWTRLASITNEDLDQTGSREARSILLKESYQAFLDHPLTGVGAGQFINYNPEGRQEAWREAHNSVLQVAAELGVIGLAVFLYLVGCAVYAPVQVRRLLHRIGPPGRHPGGTAADQPRLSAAEHEQIETHAVALTAAVVGWFVCALFASVAYHWTFYYLLALAVAPRDYLVARFSPAPRRRVAARTALASGASA